MTIIQIVLAFACGLALGLVFHFVRSKGWSSERELNSSRLSDKESELARQREDFGRALANLEITFKGLSSEVLKESRDEFIKQAEPKIAEQIRPLSDALRRYDEALQRIETKREEAYGGISKHIAILSDYANKLKDETTSLRTSLTKSSSVRGRLGEVTLRRVVELAGMSEHCSFEEQVSADGEGGRLRPDMVVRLPGGRSVVIDAKTPLDAYLKAVEAPDEEGRKIQLAAHAHAVRDHMRKLGAKAYWEQFSSATDLVVLFLPGESFFSAALETDRSLFEDGMASRVVLATPVTLIALLRSFAFGWQQVELAKNSELISEAGKELFERCSKFAGHFAEVGGGLEKAIRSFNSAVGSWESRVVPSARRLKELGATKNPDSELPQVEQIDLAPRQVADAQS